MKEIIYTKDKAYQLIRVIRESRLKNPDMETLKEYFNCDSLLRKQGKLYFCRLIEEIEYEEKKAKQQESKVLGQKLVKGTKNKEKSINVYNSQQGESIRNMV